MTSAQRNSLLSSFSVHDPRYQICHTFSVAIFSVGAENVSGCSRNFHSLLQLKPTIVKDSVWKNDLIDPKPRSFPSIVRAEFFCNLNTSVLSLPGR